MPLEPVELAVPASKSVTHRAFLLAAWSSVPCLVERPLLGADNQATLYGLISLGAEVFRDGHNMRFAPVPTLRPASSAIRCMNSGTTLRLLLGQAARMPAGVRFVGDASLSGRPNGPLLEALASLGARCASSAGGTAPIEVEGPIAPGHVSLPPSVSSQYASSLLLVLPLLDGDSTLHIAAPVASRPYLEITRQVAADFGLHWTEEEREDGLHYSIPGNQRPALSHYRVAGDWSGAAFPLLGGILTERCVRLTGLRRDSPQGDRKIAHFIGQFGHPTEWDGDALVLTPGVRRSAGTLDLGDTPDLFPALAALAAVSPGTTVLRGAPSLRHKECDRIAAMAAGLSAMGATVQEHPDGLSVTGGLLHGAHIQAHHDHRIYMAFRLLSLDVPDVVVDSAGCERVSYPDFEAHLTELTQR